MTEFDVWLKAEELKMKQYPIINTYIRALTYCLMIVFGSLSIHLVTHKTILSIIVGSLVLLSVIILAIYYHFIVLRQK